MATAGYKSKEEEAMEGGNVSRNPNRTYPDLPSSDKLSNSLGSDEEALDKLGKMPTPPPDYDKVRYSPWDNNIGVLDPDFEGRQSKYKVAGEFIISFILDTLLMFAELILNVWLALELKEQGLMGPYRGIICLIFVPSFVNAVVWFKLAAEYRRIGFYFMLSILFIGIPSPMFV